MKVKIVCVLSFMLLSTINSTAQKFCNHLRQVNQLATLNTFDPRADTFDVLSYEINASFLNYQTAKSIDASTSLQIVLLETTSLLRLDLLDLNVVSVLVNGNSVSFNYSTPNLDISLPTLAKNDTFNVIIEYDGNPKSDPQWGGFYFTGEYAFNLGVGFASDPHNFGRTWFPCFDNFTDRAIYHTNITVDSGYKAYANGYLVAVTNSSDTTQTYRWTMDDPIPTYLASVAIAKYEEVTMNVEGIPVILTSLALDTANLRSSFENLPSCIKKYQEAFGPHTFDRIGFNIVPFNAGAMEHATNIAYPKYAINGGDKASETLYAHELAHHWWGNTITCRTQEDMWLNEGWASYAERLFLEAVYGVEKYNEDIESNHRQVLQFAHVQDGAVLPVSGIGHANTYGRHVYNKGADMVHTLRGMMGDADFFKACASFQSTFKFKDVSTDDMKNHFQLFTLLNMDGFFDQWIKEAGFAHFDIINVQKLSDKYQVSVKQTPRFNEVVYKNVAVTITAFSSEFERYDEQIVIDKKEQSFDINCPFEPSFWAFDFDDKISDAVTTDWAVIKENTQFNMSQGMMNKVKVTNLDAGDSLLIRVEHHWAPADGTYGSPLGAELSRQRFWKVSGVWDDNVNISAQLTYSGLTTNSLSFGYLDNKLIRITEDSLVLLYRPNAHSAWSEAIDYTKNMGSLFDKRGSINVSNLKHGEYTLAMFDAQLSDVTILKKEPNAFKIFPNPVDKELNIEFENSHDCCVIEITNIKGQVVLSQKLRGKTKTKKLDVSSLEPGTYFIGIITENLGYDIRRFVVK